MNQFEVIFYEKENGESPLYDFIEELSPKMKAKIIEYCYSMYTYPPNL